MSKTRKDVYDAHPEWFFRSADGGPYVYNDLYSSNRTLPVTRDGRYSRIVVPLLKAYEVVVLE